MGRNILIGSFVFLVFTAALFLSCKEKPSTPERTNNFDEDNLDGLEFELSVEMMLIPGGTFTMGDGYSSCGVDERVVTLTAPFYLGKYEVTNGEYRDALQWAYIHSYITATSDKVWDNLDGSSVTLIELSYGEITFSNGVFTVDSGREDYPVIDMSWFSAVAYCDWLSLRAGIPRAYDHSTWLCNDGDPYGAAGYRLPTDAEWEFATQVNGERIYPWGNELPSCSRANYFGCEDGTSPVGSYPSGAICIDVGLSCDTLYNMAGNVSEWCNDWYTCDLGAGSVTDPSGPSFGSYRVLRGGAWNDFDDDLRCAYRDRFDPYFGYLLFGFRCARSR